MVDTLSHASSRPVHFSGIRRVLAFVALVLALRPSAVPAADDSLEPVVVRRVAGSFDDVRERVVFAIENRGLVVGHASKIGEMLARTGRDLGIATSTYGDAEVIEFCSAVLSREVTDADPRFVAYCPYGIAVYTLAAEPGAVYVGYRRPLAPGPGPLAEALARAETLLAEIVADAGE
jgi:uncharacterized protein (DUF302 family)